MINEILTLDTRIIEIFYHLRTPALTTIVAGVSELGAMLAIYGLTFCVYGFLHLRRLPAHALGLLVSVGTSGLATLLLKTLVARPRPPALWQAQQELWFSFPSAHAALSLALFGFLAYLTWHSRLPRATKHTIITVSIALIACIGVSRVYLGVHYPSDVLAGYLVGACSVWFGARSMRYYTRRI